MRRYFLSALILCNFWIGTNPAPAQILFDSNTSSPDSGLGSMPPGIIIGAPTSTPNPLYGPTTKPNVDSRSTTDPFGGGSSLDAYGGGYNVPPTFRIHPRMTREEIVRKQAEMKMWEDLEWEDQARRNRIQAEAKKNLQKGLLNLQKLFNEPGAYVPQTLGGGVMPESETPDKPTPTPTPTSEVPVKPAPEEEMTGESDSEEDEVERQLRLRRAELEKQQDSEQKQRELNALKNREESRRRWLVQRAEAERGADFFAVPPSIRLTQQRLREGWCHLFDGRTFFGWRPQKEGHYGGGRFTIEKGEIRSDPRHPGLLYTTNQFGDSTVMLEYQADEDAEVYLLLRSSPNPRDIHSSCYAVVLNSADFKRPVGTALGRNRITEEQLKESEKRLKEVDAKKPLPGSMYWNRIRAQFEGSRLQVWVNRDEPITLFDSAPLGYGYIGLLVTKGEARFRNMYWRPGSSVSLFDPITPDKHWRYRKEAIQLQTTKTASMQLTGGPGVFESRQSYGNFVLQFEYNIAFNSAKTGLFFRSVPRQEQSGYEISIQNFPTRADRDEAVGVDVGSFRGVKNGRYLRPEDQKWNYVTLVVVDRQFQTWVNGVPVCEMSDMRPMSDNPEQSPFLAPGTIQFLAPKAGTNVDFRNINISPILPRFEKAVTLDDHSQSTWEEQTRARREREQQEKLDTEMMEKK